MTNLESIFNNVKSQLHELLVALFSDSDNFVRRVLMEMPSLGQLATYFGRSLANDTILSHMVTFLNDKVSQIFYRIVFESINCLLPSTLYVCVAVHRMIRVCGQPSLNRWVL